MTKWCDKCHKAVSSWQQFCENCGRGLSPQPICDCGTEIYGHYKFCPKCGTKIEDTNNV